MRAPTRKTRHTTKRCLRKEKRLFIAWTDTVHLNLLCSAAASHTSGLSRRRGEPQGRGRESRYHSRCGVEGPPGAGPSEGGNEFAFPARLASPLRSAWAGMGWGGGEGLLSCAGHLDFSIVRRNHLPIH